MWINVASKWDAVQFITHNYPSLYVITYAYSTVHLNNPYFINLHLLLPTTPLPCVCGQEGGSLLSSHRIHNFQRCLIILKTTKLTGKIYWVQSVCSIFLYDSLKHSLQHECSAPYARNMHRNACRSSQKLSFCSDCNQN